MTIGSKLKAFSVLKPFKLALTNGKFEPLNSSSTRKGIVFPVRDLVKTQIPNLTIVNQNIRSQRTYDQNFRSV
jgi:hypothetical protein